MRYRWLGHLILVDDSSLSGARVLAALASYSWWALQSWSGSWGLSRYRSVSLSRKKSWSVSGRP